MNRRREFIKSGALGGLGALLSAGQARAQGHLSWRAGGGFSIAALDKLEERALRELKLFTDWLRANTARGFIGEFGFPGDRSKLDEYNCDRTPRRFRDDYRKWNNLAETWLKKADEARLWATIWATGEWWGDYTLAVYKKSSETAPSVNTANTQALVFEKHLSTADYERGITVAGGEFGANSGTEETLDKFSNKNPGVYEDDYRLRCEKNF